MCACACVYVCVCVWGVCADRQYDTVHNVCVHVYGREIYFVRV